MRRRWEDEYHANAIPDVPPVSQEPFYQRAAIEHETSAQTVEANPESWGPVMQGVRMFADGFGAMQQALDAAEERDGRMPLSDELSVLEHAIGRALADRYPQAMAQHEREFEQAKSALFALFKVTATERTEERRVKRYKQWATELAPRRRLGYASLITRVEAAGEDGLVIDAADQLTQDERLVFLDPLGFCGFTKFAWPHLGRITMFVLKIAHDSLYAQELPIFYSDHGERKTLSEIQRVRESRLWNLPSEVRVHERSKQRAAWDALLVRVRGGEVIWYRDKDAIPPEEIAAFLDDDYSERDWFLHKITPQTPVKISREDEGLVAITTYVSGKYEDLYHIPRP